jgi:hypothetical protein
MNQDNKNKIKGHIRDFLRLAYTDERLAWLLAHAREGKLSYHSCCCFVGIPTADHALRGVNVITRSTDLNADQGSRHYGRAKETFQDAHWAEWAFANLATSQTMHRTMLAMTKDLHDTDAKRRRIIIPMVLAEMRRRERSRGAVDMIDEFVRAKRLEQAMGLATV